MKSTGSKLGIAAAMIAWAAGMLLSGVSSATLDIQKKAKAAGFKADNCQYCHVDKLPKKGASTGNERGIWLREQKEKKKAAEVDPAWLKDYPADKK
ncbi:MAG TPA: hypothetical protein VGQ32_00670 [Thermoanaerobaculia bacterium]|jgi:hypothetical protein|nr:hypothetical protein [Thermoanaerobaculia bacterium]